jgi:hypothetical protein
MNERLKNILHTAWNEPRHFFFWLVMLSICGFAAVICGYVAVNTSLPGPTTLLAFAALGCILCFLVSLPAFVLAWIPPVRRLLAWLLRWRFLVLGCLITLIALFYAVENWRGRRAWQSFKHEREAKGERFDWAGFAKPPVPEDQNFFETPLWDDLHFVQTNGATVWNDPNHQDRVIFTIYGPKGEKAPRTGDWFRAQRVDLAAWQAFYRGSNNLFAAQGGSSTNYFPIARQPQVPAADVLLALSRFETNRQLLITAAARPYARFWANYDAGFGLLLPHLARVKSCANYLSLHADASLKAGDRQAALEDVRLVFRLMESIREEPVLISHLVRIAMLHLALQPVWEGLADRQWSEADLTVIESELGKLDFLADYEFAMRGERACTLWGVDYLHKVGPSALNWLGMEDRGGGPSAEWEKALSKCLFRLVPSGWFDQNKLSICRVHENCLLPVVDQQRGIVPPAGVARSEAAMNRRFSVPFEVCAGYVLPAVARTAKKCAQAQTFADLARLACALERYRLANGAFPESLELLAPKFIAQLPHDIINGQPLQYRRTDDGQFLLYSVGWNEADDGGKVVLTKSGYPDVDKGDWVWRYSAG